MGSRNYNWLDLNRRVEIIVDLTLIGESNLSSTSTIKLESHKCRKLIGAPNYKMHNFAIAFYNSFGQERTNEIWNYPWQNKARTYSRHLIMKCMNIMMHFHTQNINLKSVHILWHLIMKCRNIMMHFHIQTITLHWMIRFWFWVRSSWCDTITSNPILFNHKMGFTNLLYYIITFCCN